MGIAEGRVELIRRAAPLHDVGKIGISDSILLKPGKLTPGEFAMMQAHAAMGAQILARHHTPLLQLASTIALTHHERWDGSGYPAGLQAEAIPVEGRIVALADVFDALPTLAPTRQRGLSKKPWRKFKAKVDVSLIRVWWKPLWCCLMKLL